MNENEKFIIIGSFFNQYIEIKAIKTRNYILNLNFEKNFKGINKEL